MKKVCSLRDYINKNISINPVPGCDLGLFVSNSLDKLKLDKAWENCLLDKAWG